MSLVKDRHRSREFIEFLKLLETAAYPAHAAISDPETDASAHISKEPKPGSPINPPHRFEFTFTPEAPAPGST